MLSGLASFSRLNHSSPLEDDWHFQSKFAQLSANSTSDIWKSSCALSGSHRRSSSGDKILLTKPCPQLRLCNPDSVRLTGIQSKWRCDKGSAHGSEYTWDWFVGKEGDILRWYFWPTLTLKQCLQPAICGKPRKKLLQFEKRIYVRIFIWTPFQAPRNSSGNTFEHVYSCPWTLKERSICFFSTQHRGADYALKTAQHWFTCSVTQEGMGCFNCPSVSISISEHLSHRLLVFTEAAEANCSIPFLLNEVLSFLLLPGVRCSKYTNVYGKFPTILDLSFRES